MRCGNHAVRMGKFMCDFKIVRSKSLGMRPLGRPRNKWEENIRIYLKGIMVNIMNWIASTKDWNYLRAFANSALNLPNSKAIR